MYGTNVADAFDDPATTAARSIELEDHAPAAEIDLADYEEFIVFFSGGKDSVACALHLLELGIEPHRIELHHHLVDGNEGSKLMDWPVTTSYCRAFAEAFGFGYAQSWRVGGLEGEMMRSNSGTAPVAVPLVSGEHVRLGGERSKPNTRLKFPQVSADLRVRWCSAVGKIDVAARYLTANERFRDGRKRLIITGERAEESPSRARYARFEPHRCDNRGGKYVDRWLDHWRAVHDWSEQRVWQILERHRVQAHPAYHLGFGRASCRACIFLGPNGWATLRVIDPQGFGVIAQKEQAFGVTIHRDRSVLEQADRGQPHASATSHWRAIAMSTTFDLPLIVDEWVLPSGAFGENAGPV